MTGEKVVNGLAEQSSDRAADVRSHRPHAGFGGRNSAKDVTGQRLRKRCIVAGEAGFVGQNSAIEGPSHAPYVLADVEITDSHLAQRAVEIGENSVEKALAEPVRPGPIDLETMKIKKRMEAYQFKAPVDRVRYAIVCEENHLSRLLDDAPMRQLRSLTGPISTGEGKQRSCSQIPGALTTNESRLNLFGWKMGRAPISFNRAPIA
jgi:hypothetical protein